MRKVDRYRVFGVTVTAVAPNAFLAESLVTGRRMTLSARELELLMSCRTSKTLIIHARDAAWKMSCEALRHQRGLRGLVSRFLARSLVNAPESLPVTNHEVQRIYRRLKDWSEHGLLVSESHLQEGVVGKTVSAAVPTRGAIGAKIEVLAIPTAGRTATLERCLRSFIDNFVRYDRYPDIIVIDDSRDEPSQAANDQLLRPLRFAYPGRLYSMNRQQRAQFAREVATRAGVNETITDFALMGHPGCDRSEGGCWNAILLLTRGKLTLQTDDDTICQLAPAPTLEQGLALTSAASADSYWFFDSFDEAAHAVQFVDQDVLGAHEGVLNRAPAELIAEELTRCGPLTMDGMDAKFMNKVRLDDSRVRMSLLGPVGDTCLYTDLYRLFLVGHSFERLVQPPEKYHDRLSTRHVVRCVTRRTLSARLRCVGMNFAIDNREFVPPFMPVQRGGDGIFGDLMTVCCPGAFAAHLPIVLAHRPPEERLRTVDDLFELQARVRTNDIVSALVYAVADWPHGTRAENRLQTVGRYMMDLASLSPSSFESKVRKVLGERCFKGVGTAIDRLSRQDGPLYWRKDVARLIDVLTSSVVESTLSVPADVTRAQGGSEAISSELVRRFGELVLHWPAIYAAIPDFSADDVERHLTNHSSSDL